jgi:hypothetical protein
VGIIVENKVVRFDPYSNGLINNQISDNPVVQHVNGMDVYTIFRRVRTKDAPGDGNPLIHALKGAQGYSIDRANIVAFMPSFRGILAKLTPHCQADYVIPVPSRSKVAHMCAKRVGGYTGGKVEGSLLQKKMHRDVCSDLDLLLRSTPIHKQDKRDLASVRRDLGRSSSTYFSMKNIDLPLRKYFAPFKVAKVAQIPAGCSVLLVDDLLSTGTSLQCAKQLLALHGITDVRFLCLFSSTGPFTKVQ